MISEHHPLPSPDPMEDITPTSIASGRPQPDKSVTITLPIPHTFDLGNLLVNDPNPIPHNPPPATIAAVARTCAQSLINQLLTTCPIHAATTHDAASVLMTLPPPTTPLPREKPLPKPKEKTTWEKFAEKKGIQGKRRGGADGTGKMAYDEEKGEWVPKWGYKGKGGGDEEWVVEVDAKKERVRKMEGSERAGGRREEGERSLGEGRRERKENAKRNERKMRANERKARKSGGGTS